MCTPGCCPGAGRGAGTHGLLLPRRRPRFTSCGAPRTACPCRSTCLRTARSSHKCKRGHPHTHPGRGAQPGWPRDSGDQAVPRPPTPAWVHRWEARPPPTSTPGVRGAGTGWPGLAPHSMSPHRHHDPDADGATAILDLGLWSLIKVVVGVLLPSPAPRDVSPLSPAPSPAGFPHPLDVALHWHCQDRAPVVWGPAVPLWAWDSDGVTPVPRGHPPSSHGPQHPASPWPAWDGGAGKGGAGEGKGEREKMGCRGGVQGKGCKAG